MKYCVVIAAHNEADFLPLTLDSLKAQQLLPEAVVVVNDNSTDLTGEIALAYAPYFKSYRVINRKSEAAHLPGSKVVRAFQAGFDQLEAEWDFIVKLDADLILPPHYFSRIAEIFQTQPEAGMAGGFAWEENNGQWELNHPMEKDHVRGAFKAYRKSCFEDIGGLRPAMGWDTVDELLARFHGYKIITDPDLKVKHLRPTGASYTKKARLLQGKAMYTMRYGLLITVVASLKMALAQGKPAALFYNLQGFYEAGKEKAPFLVNEEEGLFIRNYRLKNIRRKLLGPLGR